MAASPITCLIVESDAQRSELIFGFLRACEPILFACHRASCLREAQDVLCSKKVALIISRGVLSDLEHAMLISCYREIENAPVVLCLLEDDEKAYLLDTPIPGADDYLFYKDVTKESLLESVQHAFERRELLCELNSVRSSAAEARNPFRGLLHCLDLALFLVTRPEGELLFSNKVADAWCADGKELVLAELFEYGVLNGESIELEVRMENTAAPVVELRSVGVEWKGRGCALITLRNISKRKRAEEAYCSSQRRLELALKASNIGLWSWDLRSSQLHFSDRWKQQLGYASNEFPNTMEAFRQNLHLDDHVEVEKVFVQALRGERHEIELKYRMRHKSGEYRWILCRAEIFPDESGQLSSLLGSHIDITDRDARFEPRKSYLSLLERLNVRMEEIAAEIEVNAIQLREEFRGDSAIVERIHNLERLAARFSCLNEIRQADNFESESTEVDLARVAYDLFKRQHSLLPRKAKLTVESRGKVELQGWSLGELRLALTGALICVSARISRDVKSEVCVVVEHGKGASEFSAGPVLRFRYKGTSVAPPELQELSRAVGIALFCETEGDVSLLSLSFESGPLLPPKSRPSRPLALLAEDEGVLRLAIRAMLESLGFDVMVAGDGAAALEIFDRQKAAFELVLIDLQMPEVDGGTVATRIRAERADLALIRMSGDSGGSESEFQIDSDELGCFLSKPFGIEDLRKTLEALRCRALA